MGSRGVLLAEGADHFGELLHEVAFRVEAACGVAEEELDIAATGAVPSIVAERCRVALILASHDFNAEFAPPCAELLDGCRAEGVCGNEEARVVLGFQPVRKLRTGGRFTGAVDSSHKDGKRTACQGNQWRVLGGEDFEYFLPEHLQGGFTTHLATSGSHGLEDDGGHGNSEISANESFLQFVPVHRASSEAREEAFKKSSSHTSG